MENKEIMGTLYSLTKELSPSAEYNESNKEFVEEREKLLKEIGKDYREEIENLTNIQNDMGNELSKQAFEEGFSIAVKLFVNALTN